MKNKKYTKINVNMFESRKFKIIENMEKKDMIEVIWVRLLLEATKTNDGGYIYLEKDIPYSISELSIVLGRCEDDIAMALEVLSNLRMIEVYENNLIKVLSWSDHQESSRKKKAKEKDKKEVIEGNVEEINDNKESSEEIVKEPVVEKIAGDVCKDVGDRKVEEIKSEFVFRNENSSSAVKKKRISRRKERRDVKKDIGDGIDDEVICSIEYGNEDDFNDGFIEGEYVPKGNTLRRFSF